MPTTSFGADVGIVRRRPYIDPLQQEYAALARQQREIIAQMRAMKERMKTGTCDVCGSLFSRSRVTRRFCSQRCLLRNHAALSTVINMAAIEQALPFMVAGNLLTQRSVEIVQQAIASIGNQVVAAEEIGLSRQRINQVLIHATKLAETTLAMRAAFAEGR